MSSRESKGSIEIKDWLRIIDKEQRWLMGQLDKSSGYISQICNGRKPSTDVAFAIEELSDGLVKAQWLLYRGASPLGECRERAA